MCQNQRYDYTMFANDHVSLLKSEHSLQVRIAEKDPAIVGTPGAGCDQRQESGLGGNRDVYILNAVQPRRIAQVKTNDAVQKDPDVGGAELSLRQVFGNAAHGGESVNLDIRMILPDLVQVEGDACVGMEIQGRMSGCAKTDTIEPGRMRLLTGDVKAAATICGATIVASHRPRTFGKGQSGGTDHDRPQGSVRHKYTVNATELRRRPELISLPGVIVE